MRILGLDPGSVNFGYAVVDVDEEYSYLKDTYVEVPTILEHGLLKNISGYFANNDLDSALLRICVQELQEICLRHSVDRIAIERWMGRGTFMPGWVERLNHVIGAMLYSSPIPIKAITAASWKTRILKRYGIKSTKTLVGSVKSEHAGDAVMQATYIHELELEALLKSRKAEARKSKKK
jgi:hypothetical protein